MDDLDKKLLEAEGSGRIEFKRSVLWPLEKDDIKVQGVLMRLANTNPEEGALLHLGREDDGTIIGLVDKTLAPVTATNLKASEQKLGQLAQKLDPPMQIRWIEHCMHGLQTIVVDVPGRPRGGWFQDETGVTKTGAGSHPIVAKQALLQSWAREGYSPGGPAYLLRVAAYTRALVFAPTLGESETVAVLTVDVSNVGSATSYVASISFRLSIGGRLELVSVFSNPYDALLNAVNDKFKTPLEPGRTHSIHYRLESTCSGLKTYVTNWLRISDVDWSSVVLADVIVFDEIGNNYSAAVSEASQKTVQRYLATDLTG